jgi:hypothetical protein
MSKSRLVPVLAALLALGGLAVPGTAHAYWRGGHGGGVFFGFAPPPVYFGPPAYYYAPPPPVVYAPPPVIYDPTPAPRAAAQSCYAGAYVCPLAAPGPVGSPCSCPTDRGRIAGRTG